VLDVKNEKFFEEYNEELIKFKVDFDENLKFIDKKMKTIAAPSGDTVTYDHIAKTF
jgi:hypothetical protein